MTLRLNGLLTVLTIAVLTPGCTITPEAVNSNAGSVSGNDSTPPIALPSGAWSVNSGDLARYNALIPRYGKRFLIPVRQNDGCSPDIARPGRTVIDQEHMIDFGQMAGWYRDDEAKGRK